MKCPECEKEEKKSTIQVGLSTTTAMAGREYYDEEGKYHYDNPNHTTTQYHCSNGHTFTKII